jgi:uncharacterized protein YndB with AHSA1/START domain
MAELATFDRRGDELDVRFVRHYPRPVEKVWAALTDPARLADWMGAAKVEPFVGGRFDLMTDSIHGSTGIVRVWDPPRVLEFSWSNTHSGDAVIRYELTPERDGTRLVLSHRGMPYLTSALMLPGWHDFLDRLGTLVSGGLPPQETNFRAMQATYIDHYKLEGVQLDP